MTNAILRRMDHKLIFNVSPSVYEEEEGPCSEPVTIRMPRATFDNGMAATLVSSMEGDRRTFIGAVEFMECASKSSMTVDQLIRWYDEYLVQPGYMAHPKHVFHPDVGSVNLEMHQAENDEQNLLLRRILTKAHEEVCRDLLGLLDTPQKEDFIVSRVQKGKIFALQVGNSYLWRMRANDDDSLSNIILCLFAIDILANRRVYDERFSMCTECRRISFRRELVRHQRCPTHLPLPAATSETHA